MLLKNLPHRVDAANLIFPERLASTDTSLTLPRCAAPILVCFPEQVEIARQGINRTLAIPHATARWLERLCSLTPACRAVMQAAHLLALL